MYALVEIKGKQFKVSDGDKIESFNINKQIGETFEINPVGFHDGNSLITEKKKLISIIVTCQVIEHKKGIKLYVFKKKPKTGYSRGIGHRDHLTVLKISLPKPEADKPKEDKPKVITPKEDKPKKKENTAKVEKKIEQTKKSE